MSSSGSQSDHQHGVGELEVGNGGLQRGARARGPERDPLAGPRVDVGRVEGFAHQARQQEALLVGGLAADKRADVALVAPQASGVVTLVPRDRTEVAAVADQRPVIRSSTWIAW